MLAGPNGAGKTTFAIEYLPAFAECLEFVNADLIAAGLSPFAPETQTIRAGKLFLTRIKELSAARRDFGFETTLAGRTYMKTLKDTRMAGYRTMLFFLWLPNADLAVARVANRVHQGGHSVPEDTIRRRFDSGLRNLFQVYLPLVDAWWLYDASPFPPVLAAHESELQRHIYETRRISMSPFKEPANVGSVNENIHDELTAQVEAAMRAAAREVLRVAKQTGTPVIIWENGQVRRIPWDQFDEVTLKIKDR